MEKLREKVRESLSSVLPITIIVLLLSIVLIPMEVERSPSSLQVRFS